tara:strand:+ start:15551 stop:17422 length:1872 start_codon:yes stop_codon:yes gene_type:complete
MERRISEDISVLGKVSVNFSSISSTIFSIYEQENEVARQKSIPHLGLISRAFSGINHTRYEYLILQCVISELAENSFKGTSSAQGDITIDGTKYNGNQILKSWFLLSNFGHCKNTIGDEKALLLKAINRKGFKSHLLKPIKDKDLKVWSEKVIDNFDYVKFHHILSIRRIYKSLKRRIATQNEIIKIYKLYLLDSKQTSSIANELKVEQLKMIHKNIRDLAIISLDSRNSSLPISIDILSTVLSFDFYENRFQQTQVSELFHPNLSLLIDNLYLHPKSQTFQRSYEINALKSISTNHYSGFCDKAINTGLADPSDCHLKHFLRTTFQFDDIEKEDLKENLRLALTVKRGVSNVDSSLDFNPFSSTQVMDFYIDAINFKTKSLPRFLSNIIGILNNQMEDTVKRLVDKRRNITMGIYTEIKKLNLKKEEIEVVMKPAQNAIVDEAWELIQNKNIPAFKGILWAILQFHIKEDYYFDIDHHTYTEFKYFGVKSNNGMDFLTQDIITAIENADDRHRKHELKQLLKSVKRKYEGTTIACLSRINIYDYSKAPSKRKVTDIDSVVLKFNNNNMILEFHEAKNTKNPINDAKKDLKKKFVKILNDNSKGYKLANIKGFGCKVVIKHGK